MSVDLKEALRTCNHTDKWDELPLSVVCRRLTDGSHFSPKPQLYGQPIANVKDLADGYVDIESCTKIKVDDFNVLMRSGCDVQRNDVLLSKDGTIGRVVVYRQDTPLVALSSIALLRPGPDFDSSFLGHALHSAQVTKQIGVYVSGSALRRLVLRDVNQIRVPTPPVSVQQRIAAVLDTVDEAIAKTEAVIAKLRQVRAGLLHDVLTRGLDERDQPRDPVAHPEQFKDSPLGRISREWTVRKLFECYKIPGKNGLYKKASCYGSGNRMVHMPQMFKGITLDVTDAVPVSVEPQEIQRFSLEEGDLLFARRSLNLEGAGLCSMVPKLDEPVTFESSIVRVRLNRDLVVSRFAVEFLRSPRGYILRRPFIRQVAVSGVSGEDISHFSLPCPQLAEQERILALLDSHDFDLRIFELERAKLELMKSGLMTDLLTGRVRVPETQPRAHDSGDAEVGS